MSLNTALAHGSKLKVVALESTNSVDFVSQVFRNLERGMIVMVCPPRSTDREIFRGIEVIQEVTPAPSHGWHSFAFTGSQSSEPAHISFTSGTTGSPKGIVLSHGALQDVVERLNNAMGIQPDIREYVGVPVNFSFGFGRCRAVAAVGGTCFIPATGFNPIQLADMINSGEINAISAVPTQWRAFFKAAGMMRSNGSKVRWIEIGSQYMSRAEKEQLKRLFPNALILQHYGLTEASRTTFLDITHASGDALESVGRTVGKTEISLSNDGRIRIRGPHVALGELREGAIHPLVDDEGWLQTNDLGSIRDGYLYFAGRADDLINCGGTKIPSELFEKALLQELGAEGGIAVGPAADEMRGQIVLVVTDHDSRQRQDQIEAAAQSVATRFGLGGAGVLRFAQCGEIPRTPTGKVKRHELASLEEAPPIPPTNQDDHTGQVSIVAESNGQGTKAQLVSIWQSVLGMQTVPTDKSFFELGGDSLSAMAVMVQIERLKVPAEIARKVFEGKTIQQIVDEVDGRESQMTGGQLATVLGSRVINATRGFLVLLVIGGHWLPWLWARLPGVFSKMDYYLRPLYRLGTPGFALVFGLGWGYFQIPLYRSNPSRFFAIARRNAVLLFAAILLLGGGKAAATLFSHAQGDSPDVFVSSFYSVLTCYFLIVVASPILLRPLVRSSNVIIASLLMSIVAFGCEILARSYVSPNQGSGVTELIRLMLTAKYNIFGLTAIVFLGTSLGAAYRRAVDADALAHLPLLGLGACIAGFGVITSYHTDGISAWMQTHGQEPWALATYTGLIMFACGCIQRAFTAARLPFFARKLIEGLAIIGVLSLPAYVLHEVVIPAKVILSELGVPELLALSAPVAAFLGVMAYLYSRLRRIYFASPNALIEPAEEAS